MRIVLLGLMLLIGLLGLVWLVRTQWHKIHPITWGVAGVIIGIYAILIIIGGIHSWQNEKNSESVVPYEDVVMSFIQDMNPKLVQKMKEIKAEIALAKNKLQQLQALKKAFPNQAEMIEQKINHWQTLELQLTQVSDNIDQQVEKAYVAYKIDEIQGKHKFTTISDKLLKEANAVLANAETTKSIIEEQIDE